MLYDNYNDAVLVSIDLEMDPDIYTSWVVEVINE